MINSKELNIHSVKKKLDLNWLDKLQKKEFLIQWIQTETTDHLTDIIPHFLLIFKSVHTQRAYLKDLKDFFNFLADQDIHPIKISELIEEQVISWRVFLLQKKLAQESLRRKLNALSSLFKFCLRRKLISLNIVDIVQKPRALQSSKTNIFTFDEVKLILSFLKERAEKSDPKQKKHYFSDQTKYVIITLLFAIGMRINELCTLKIIDFEKSTPYMQARLNIRHAKGDLSYSPFIHPNAAQILQNYIDKMRTGSLVNDFIFVRSQEVKDRSHLSTRFVHYMLKEIVYDLGIKKLISPHSCRATLATLLHKNGLPINQIQELLNHKDISTTAIYIKKSNELEEAAARKIQF